MFGYFLCLFHAHKWGRLSVYTIDGDRTLFETCMRCDILRKAVIL